MEDRSYPVCPFSLSTISRFPIREKEQVRAQGRARTRRSLKKENKPVGKKITNTGLNVALLPIFLSMGALSQCSLGRYPLFSGCVAKTAIASLRYMSSPLPLFRSPSTSSPFFPNVFPTPSLEKPFVSFISPFPKSPHSPFFGASLSPRKHLLRYLLDSDTRRRIRLDHSSLALFSFLSTCRLISLRIVSCSSTFLDPLRKLSTAR